jgi:hypothetical protein
VPRASLIPKPRAVSSRSNDVAFTQLRPTQKQHAPIATEVGLHEAPSWDFSRIPIHPSQTLLIGAASDPLEAAANHAASMPVATAVASAGGPPSSRLLAPAVVGEALASPGRPLDAASRNLFEGRYRHDFSGVRLHADGVAARSAEAIGARAYTVDEDIVLGREGAAPSLLAHELAHVVQQSASRIPWVQRAPASTGKPVPAVPRKTFVFIMGKDPGKHPEKGPNPFYTIATRYFHAHVPAATFVEDQRSLAGLLSWISSNVTAPIGDLYIVSHGNEDGTLAFGLHSSKAGERTSVVDLRRELHPKGGGSSTLASVSSVIDARTKIHIKGCDIGRTQEMVELIDEAFGGAGTVTAPTHEQQYDTDPTLGGQARHQAHDKQIGAFTAGLPALPPKPAAIDPKLKGAARKQAKMDFDAASAVRKQAETARTQAIAGEEKRIKPALDDIADKAGTVDALSGPMFQRPGTTLFKAAEIQPEIDRLYGHLPEAQRKKLAKQLVAPDSGKPDDQHGQKVIRVRPFSQTVNDPASFAEAKSLYAEDLKKNNFVPKSAVINRTAGGIQTIFTDASQATWTYKDPPIPDDATIIAGGKENNNNPGRYQWRVERKHSSSGKTTLTAVGERVKAYLHHGSLDASKHDHFSRPEGDKDFYATSTFKPPPPAKP